MSEQRINIGSTVLIETYRRGLTEAKVLRVANHPRYDTQSIEVEYVTIFGKRVRWFSISDIEGILPETD